MSPRNPELSDAWQLRQKSLSRWENEGGAVPSSHQGGIVQSDAVPQSNSELVRRRVRVIALENLVISLLARSSDRQLDLVREMPAYISPRTGLAPHHLTIRAAAEMIHLIERASHFWDMPTNERAVGLVTERGGARAAKCASRWSFDLRIGCRESSS
jgi:hypothetical protein